ncbi:MAG: DUF1844 domain-containing protein [Candidatus Marinimicrobia bacterium]|nr:DUF1844 domain-containing protein [Candidatus Neomarinimicrobiota bacterium]MCF7903853.1 DUF1844 domain-containing protein [Candidatus Neomarinimicrobiota bacterium]
MTQTINPKDLFSLLVQQLSASASMQLGMTPNPITRKTEVNLQAAEMTVGILETLLFKTAGNLNKAEDALLSAAVRDMKLKLQELKK